MGEGRFFYRELHQQIYNSEPGKKAFSVLEIYQVIELSLKLNFHKFQILCNPAKYLWRLKPMPRTFSESQ